MSFGSPLLLVALAAVPAAVAAYVVQERRRARQAAAWGSTALLPNVVPRAPGRRRHVPAALLLLGLAFLLVGLARPKATFSAEREGATVVLALDTSRSMQARDVKPTRLRAARAAAFAFLHELPGKYRVALVTFADHASVAVAPTYDRDRVRKALERRAAGEGTALGDGIERSVTVAARAVGPVKAGTARPPAAVLLISDGAQTQGRIPVAQAAKKARRAHVPVWTISLGTANGVVTRKLPGGFTERITVPPDPKALRAVAQATGGHFARAATAATLRRVYKDLGSRAAHERRPREISAGAAGAGLALMLAGAALSATWFRRLV